ncbi:ABC transporter ATP-binding protein [Mucilaginibacter sp. L196]|uniref:ABC transporter ATP-binding protein n=1 Tax=Mucilaginibacter sp. L196 TaxID=1641870 RepID=UPI00131D0845|nr:ABC transporter ATP-binding protein [Mucilaginibacter sp. L196]
MSDIAIRVENLSKAYQLGDFGTGTLSRDLERWWALMRGKEDPFLKIGEVNDRTSKGESDIVWSLKDINFDIKEGDAVGIIGRNGAGKSTLLKVLSRVTSPTTGNIKVKGRIASLLEVGTGFHPELTGAENIYLNGAIMGMTKREIKKRFDEIVDFAGVDRYVDTPVKRYSSGMYVRLAFAVAAHLDSEILIVDEVLAVGDAEFQNKCLGKMGDVSKGEGRTVLFVSHNMGSINQLCNKAILLNNGNILDYDNVSIITPKYFNFGKNNDASIALHDIKRTGNGYCRFESVELRRNNENFASREFSIGDDLNIVFKIRYKDDPIPLKMSVELKTSDGLKLSNMIDVDSGYQTSYIPNNSVIKITLPDLRLYPDTYYLSLYVGDLSSVEPYDYLEDCISFDIIDGGTLTTRPLPRSAGLLFLTPKWEVL